MKFVIISDSHGNSEVLEKVFVRERNIDGVIHLGDGSDDLWGLNSYIGRLPVYHIRGNNDRSHPNLSDKLISYFGNIKFFACHGHHYDVKYGLVRLHYAALEAECRLVLFGHTHIPYNESTDEITFFNPGCAYKGFYGILETKGDEFSVKNKNIYD